MPLTYGRLNGTEGWYWKHPDRPLPLYGLNKLSAFPDAQVILCEGEKAANAAQDMFPDRVCLAWARGAESAKYADLTPLALRHVTLWPDADDAGRKAAQQIIAKLHVEFIVNTDGLDDGFDAADLVTDDPGGWLAERLMRPEPPQIDDPGYYAPVDAAAKLADDDGFVTEDSVALAFA